MNAGDLVTVLYERKRYYIILEKLPRKEVPFGEQMYMLLNLEEGNTRSVRYSEIRMINAAQKQRD
tara:strand:+ start:360 stop:554 length:195 start_codon:yes stop_codon:yes gene_type:complete